MKAIICITMTGVASAAMAQSASLNLVMSSTSVDLVNPSTITLSVYASADFGTHIAGGEFALVGGSASAGSIAGMDASAAAWGAFGENDRGWAGGTDYTGLVFGQLIAPPFFPPSEDSRFTGGEVLLGTIQVDLTPPFSENVLFQLDSGLGPFVLEIFDEADGSLTQVTAGDVSFGNVLITVPAPSSIMMLGLSGLVAGRRRR